MGNQDEYKGDFVKAVGQVGAVGVGMGAGVLILIIGCLGVGIVSFILAMVFALVG